MNAITVENLSKAYRIGLKEEVPDTLVGSVKSLARSPMRNFRKLRRLDTFSRNGNLNDVIWALNEVSFAITEGEVVGIIGRNGAGKSTLLKILSRITGPTSGRVVIRGRVSSLLEVGTGFHPELTGRENVYMNGTILGMSKREIDRKFDKIVDFSGVEKFLDTPVKRYSSGMSVRLAFAVAAHLEPEILIVDEVLAVGDAEFQKKCLGRMSDVAHSGRTVLFVSHNMGAVSSLCSRSLVLARGAVTMDGATSEAVNQYTQEGSQCSSNGEIFDNTTRSGTGDARIRRVCMTDETGRVTSEFRLGQPLCVTFDVEVLSPVRDPHFEVSISTPEGIQITSSLTHDQHVRTGPLPRGTNTVSATIHLVLLPRQYTLLLGVHRGDGQTIDFIEHTCDFTVLNVPYGDQAHHRWKEVRGYVRPDVEWKLPNSNTDSTASEIGK